MARKNVAADVDGEYAVPYDGPEGSDATLDEVTSDVPVTIDRDKALKRFQASHAKIVFAQFLSTLEKARLVFNYMHLNLWQVDGVETAKGFIPFKNKTQALEHYKINLGSAGRYRRLGERLAHIVCGDSIPADFELMAKEAAAAAQVVKKQNLLESRSEEIFHALPEPYMQVIQDASDDISDAVIPLRMASGLKRGRKTQERSAADEKRKRREALAMLVDRFESYVQDNVHELWAMIAVGDATETTRNKILYLAHYLCAAAHFPFDKKMDAHADARYIRWEDSMKMGDTQLARENPLAYYARQSFREMMESIHETN